MSGIGVKWCVRRVKPSVFGPDVAMTPTGQFEQMFDNWSDLCKAADTILGEHNLKMGTQPADPLIFQRGEEVVLIYMKLEI